MTHPSDGEHEPARLPTRWALILVATAGVGALAFTAGGLPTAVVTALTALGVFHAVIA